MVKLSICMPTYNRGKFIGQALESVLAQSLDGIEIVIVDGASSDNTETIVRDYQRRYPCIRYFRRDTNVGIDADVLKVVDLARGQYCWLFSDDDCMEPGSIPRVLEKLARHPNVAGASLNSTAYDKDLRFPVRTVPAASNGRLQSDHVFHDHDACFSMLGVHFGYLSAQVVNRSLWLEVISAEDLSPYYNAWLLVYIIGRMLQRNPSWLYVHEPCVAYRSGNDSFISRLGAYRRQLITHVAFEQTVGDLFGRKSAVYRQVLCTLVSDRMARSLAVLKSDGISLGTQLKLMQLYFRQYRSFPVFWLKVFPLFLVPNFTFKLARKAYLGFRAWSARRAGTQGPDASARASAR